MAPGAEGMGSQERRYSPRAARCFLYMAYRVGGGQAPRNPVTSFLQGLPSQDGAQPSSSKSNHCFIMENFAHSHTHINQCNVFLALIKILTVKTSNVKDCHFRAYGPKGWSSLLTQLSLESMITTTGFPSSRLVCQLFDYL